MSCETLCCVGRGVCIIWEFMFHPKRVALYTISKGNNERLNCVRIRCVHTRTSHCVYIMFTWSGLYPKHLICTLYSIFWEPLRKMNTNFILLSWRVEIVLLFSEFPIFLFMTKRMKWKYIPNQPFHILPCDWRIKLPFHILVYARSSITVHNTISHKVFQSVF